MNDEDLKKLEAFAEEQYQKDKEEIKHMLLCTSACKGIPNEALKSDVIGEMVRAMEIALSDLKWIESLDEKNNFQSTISMIKHIQAKLKGN